MSDGTQPGNLVLALDDDSGFLLEYEGEVICRIWCGRNRRGRRQIYFRAPEFVKIRRFDPISETEAHRP